MWFLHKTCPEHLGKSKAWVLLQQMHHRFAKANGLTQLLKIKRNWGVLTTRSLSVCLFLSNFLSIRKPRGWRSSFIEAHWIPPMKIQTKSMAENNHQILSRSFKLSMGSRTNDWVQNAWCWLQGSSSRRICGALNVLRARISRCYGDSWWITRANTRPAPRIQSAKWGSKACSPWSNRSGSHSYFLDVSLSHTFKRMDPMDLQELPVVYSWCTYVCCPSILGKL